MDLDNAFLFGQRILTVHVHMYSVGFVQGEKKMRFKDSLFPQLVLF